MSEKELQALLKSYGESLHALNDLGISAIENIETRGFAVFNGLEKKAEKMLNQVRNFAILFLLLFGAAIGYLFIEIKSLDKNKANAKDVMYKYETIFLHNAESQYTKKVIDKAAEGVKVDDDIFCEKMVDIRKEWLNVIVRGNNIKN